MAQLVLHIGINKTASTTLQETLFAEHPDILYLGKWAPNTSRGWRNEDIYRLIYPVLWGDNEAIDQDQLESDYMTLVTKPSETHRVAIGSNEGLGVLPAEHFGNLLDGLKKIPDKPRILILLRNPLTWIPSYYLQQVQRQFIKRSLDNVFNKRPWFSLDNWLNTKQGEPGGIKELFSSVGNTRHAVEQLGRRNVGVFLFESMKDDPDQFFRNLADFLNICPERAVELAQNSHRNPRITQAFYDYAQKVNANWISRVYWRLQGRSGRTRSMRMADNKPGASKDGARVELSELWRDRIASVTREDNKWLRDELGLPVEKFGYPL